MIDVVFNMVDVKLKNRIEDGCNVTKRKLGPVSEKPSYLEALRISVQFAARQEVEFQESI